MNARRSVRRLLNVGCFTNEKRKARGKGILDPLGSADVIMRAGIKHE